MINILVIRTRNTEIIRNKYVWVKDEIRKFSLWGLKFFAEALCKVL